METLSKLPQTYVWPKCAGTNISARSEYRPDDLSARFYFAEIIFSGVRGLNLLTCRTHWETTPSGTSGNFWRRSCKTWMSIWWLPWAIRMLPGQDCLFCSAHWGVSRGSKPPSSWTSSELKQIKKKENIWWENQFLSIWYIYIYICMM